MLNAMKTIIKILSVVLCLSLFICGCANSGSEEPTPTPSEIKLADNQVLDQLGRIVDIPENIDKVAATHVYGGKMLFAMGQMEKIAYQLQLGADTESVAKIDPVYGALDDITSTPTGNDSPETMLQYEVDVIFTDASQGMEEISMYENAGITCIAVSGESFEEVYETAEIMGKVFGTPDKAEELINFVETKRNAIIDKTKALSDADKPVVLVTGSGGLYTAATGQMFQSQMVETAGGINAAKDLTATRWAKISAEDIIAWDPDYIVLGSSFGKDSVEEILADPALQTVTAIKEKQVYTFPSNLGWWDFPLPQSILGTTWIATIIHPELFPDTDILKEANEVYEYIFGYTYEKLGGVISETSLAS